MALGSKVSRGIRNLSHTHTISSLTTDSLALCGNEFESSPGTFHVPAPDHIHEYDVNKAHECSRSVSVLTSIPGERPHMAKNSFVKLLL